MSFDPNVTKLSIYAGWKGRRREPPEVVADRLRAFIDHIGTLDDSLAHWSIGKRKRVPYATARSDLATLVEDNVCHEEMGNIDRNEGYSIVGGSKNAAQGFSLVGSAGGTYGFPLWNMLLLYTKPGCLPDPKIVTYALFRELFLAMIGCWQPAFAVVDSNEERTPDGGLLLSATEQMFRAHDPAHREGARRISQALQPLNAMLPQLTHPFDWPAENEWMSNA